MTRTLTGAIACLVLLHSATAFSEDHVFGGPLQTGPCVDPGYLNSIPLPQGFPATIRMQSSLSGIYTDPMGPGISNSPGRPITNFVDLDSSGGTLDFRCGHSTYDTHQGEDILIRDFYEMDEGVPVLCARDGLVTFVMSGAFDRNYQGLPAPVNLVRVNHDDGTWEWYLHFRKNSIRVQNLDSVHVGDTLGFAGSSGKSTWPHLHFQVGGNLNPPSAGVVEPCSGPCQTGPSLWISQPTYTLDLPTDVMTAGLTSLAPSTTLLLERPPNATHVTDPAGPTGGTFRSWVILSSMAVTDSLSWTVYDNAGAVWTYFAFAPGSNYTLSYWYSGWVLPDGPTAHGSWRVDVHLNGSLVSSDNFSYDGASNFPPSISPRTFFMDVGDTLNDEFSATDPDGNIFWYNVARLPSNGTLTQDGGRRRKFRYMPRTNPPFIGIDTVVFNAIDDDSISGPTGEYYFQVSCTDVDGDGVCHVVDNCPTTSNPGQEDSDGDGLGNVCDACPSDPQNDADGDQHCSNADNCPTIANSDQQDIDHDGIGDACDPCVDPDGDSWGSPGYPTAMSCDIDNCPSISNVFQDDLDADGIGDACDNCPEVPNPLQEDANNNGIGNACECACNCHGDPVCDNVINNVQDVVAVINVAFRSAAPIVDPNASCPNDPTDVNCDGFTSVVDVVKIVNVAFRAANPATEFCNPCP